MRNLSARLYQPDSIDPSATAWLVCDDFALTAYHCILDARNRPYSKHKRFQLEFDSGEKVQAVVTEYSKKADAAILHILDYFFETAGKITFGFLPTNKVWEPREESRKRWTGWGYPSGRP